jgi:hypothetical protein
LVASVLVSVQARPDAPASARTLQRPSGVAHEGTQTLLTQAVAPPLAGVGQALPHSPQLAALLVRSTQVPLQTDCPAVQAGGDEALELQPSTARRDAAIALRKNLLCTGDPLVGFVP